MRVPIQLRTTKDGITTRVKNIHRRFITDLAGTNDRAATSPSHQKDRMVNDQWLLIAAQYSGKSFFVSRKISRIA